MTWESSEAGRAYYSKWRANNREKERLRAITYRKNNTAKARAACRRWQAANKDGARNRKYLARYGITWAEREAMFAAQGNCCAACGSDTAGSKSGWHTDHNPSLQKGDPLYVRGIICHQCNIALGPAATPDKLRKLATYLEKHNGQ